MALCTQGCDIMGKNIPFCFFASFVILIFILNPLHVTGESLTHSSEGYLPLQATAAILVEQTTGRVLYSRNPHARMYPASTTKLLTALVAIQHLDLDTVVVVGPEIRGMPVGFATNLHAESETITVDVLLKALLIRSSNEAGRILAIETVRTIDDNRSLQYSEAKTRFSQLMNQMAHSLGATNSNFNNPYGLHSEFHYTTAYDMALIGRAFMEVPELVGISAIREFEGDSLGNRFHPQAYVRQYSWTNTNLMLPGAAFGHPYIIAGRTGFTTPAGHCFVGGAYHNGLSLVSVVLYSQEPARWQDTRVLIDHGFINYAFREIATEGTLLATAIVENPRLGDSNTLEVLLQERHVALLGRAEYASIQRELVFDPLLLVEAYTGIAHDAESVILRAPIEEGAAVGTVVYKVFGEIIFSTPAIAARAVYERTFDSDMDYYLSMIFGNIFTRRALPYWFAVLGTLFGVVNLILAITISRRARRLNNWHTPPRRR